MSRRATTGLTRRRLLRGALALPLLAACSTGRARPTALRVYLPVDAYERAFFEREVLPDFTRRTNIAVSLYRGTGAEAVDRLDADRRAGQHTLDALSVTVEGLGPLIAAGLVTELTGTASALPDETIPALRSASRLGERAYAWPLRAAVWVTFYNRALLATRAAAPPPDLDALLDLARMLHETPGSGQIALQGAPDAAAQSLIELVWAFGGDPLTLSDPGARAAGRYLRQLAPFLTPVSATAKFDSMTTALATDRVALGANWSVVAEDLLLRAGKDQIGVYAGPLGPAGRGRLISGQLLALPASTPADAGAGVAQLAAYLTSRAVQERLAHSLAWLPMRADALGAAPRWQQPVAEACAEALATAQALPPLEHREAIEAVLSAGFRAIAFEHAAPKSVLDQAAARLQALR